MNLISVNLGQERILTRKDRVERTGIFKFPTLGSVMVTKLGLAGDVIVSKKHHGGPDQAIYVYGGLDYEWWTKELIKDCSPGMFGENLTISDLESTVFNIGDYLHIGEVSLQISAPRIPCATFAARMGDPQWVRKFRRAERPGLYCRVIKEGSIKAGESISIEKYNGDTISILEMFRSYYDNGKSEESIRRFLNTPIDTRSRNSLQRQLSELTG